MRVCRSEDAHAFVILNFPIGKIFGYHQATDVEQSDENRKTNLEIKKCGNGIKFLLDRKSRRRRRRTTRI